MTDRRSFIKKTLLGTTLLGVSSFPFESFAATKPVKLTILHTNDMHSRIDPFPKDDEKYGGMGGMAKRATVIDKIREDVEHVLLLDAGDIFQGTPYFNLYGGELEFKLMSAMGYDAATLGNHDFDNGLKGLHRQLPHASFPFLTANYDFQGTILQDTFQPYKIFDKGSIKVGVFGLGIELSGLVADKHFGKTKYRDPIATAQEMVKTLRENGCHFVVCLSHLGFKYQSNKVSDQVLAKNVNGIDLIIGGHTHTFLEQPEQLLSPDGHVVYINQVGFGGINLGRIDCIFERKNRKRIEQSSLTGIF